MWITLNKGECPSCFGSGYTWLGEFKHSGLKISPVHDQSICSMCGGTGKLPKPIYNIEIPPAILNK